MSQPADQAAPDPSFVSGLVEQLIEYGPKIALFVGIVIGGLIASAVARRLARWLVEKVGLDALAEKAGAAKLLYAVGIRKGIPHVVGSLVWICGLLLTGAALAEMLGLSGVADGVAAIVGFLPRLAAAAVIVVAGGALAGLLRRIATGFGKNREDVEQPEVLGNLAYYGVMTITVIVAADQAGLETELLKSLFTTLIAIGATAIALAFALGSRGSFHNLVAGHFFKRMARPGDRVRVGDVEGVIVRYFGVSVVLKTDNGEVAVPCDRILEHNVELSRLGAKARAQAAQSESAPPSASEPPAVPKPPETT